MKIEIELTEQEFSQALQLCSATGYPSQEEYLKLILRRFLITHSFFMDTPMGELGAHIDISSDENENAIAISFLPEKGDGSTVNLARTAYKKKRGGIFTEVFEDITMTNATRQFVFKNKDVQEAFRDQGN